MPEFTVMVKGVVIGGNAPMAIQSMTNTDTMDVAATVAQCRRIADAGADLVRITVPSMREVAAMQAIKKELHAAGYDIPLIADVHFNPQVAVSMAAIADKVRINPGNYSDRVGKKKEWTETEYRQSLTRMAEKAQSLFEMCRKHGTAIRIGVNHGSLSSRIISRFGNTPQAMAMSAMEWMEVCRQFNFHQVVFSMKSSNVLTMIEATMLLYSMMQEKKLAYPLHIGVTETGNGLEGRAKSAAGIGALLLSGIGNTVRVSLTEPPENEVVFAKLLLEELVQIEYCNYTFFDGVLHYAEPKTDKVRLVAQAAALCGYLHYYHKVKKLVIENPNFSTTENQALADIILQACRIKMSKTEFISCPSCGRTQYNITEVLEKVKAQFGHYPNLKIGVMGCIVNGPGEMADADFGIVGGTKDKVAVFRGKERVSNFISVEEALLLLQQIMA
ncbi:MAG: (E)-4-hydroxy-3-methylbut-2-enyl-diphosphate synthase [Bacteroidales bacterium]|nr:(E)-4-hydroxy-3-methylbut-2-enyl-diphosphate synthase [Bacteroidales bacterium]